MIDKRSKIDIQQLLASLENPDKNLLEKYFGDTALTLAFGKILHQRLVDEGVYERISDVAEIKRIGEIVSGLQSADTDKAHSCFVPIEILKY